MPDERKLTASQATPATQDEGDEDFASALKRLLETPAQTPGKTRRMVAMMVYHEDDFPVVGTDGT